MVWKETKAVGCAVNQATVYNDRGYPVKKTYVCCNYWPPGNIAGEFKKNVSPPKKELSELKPLYSDAVLPRGTMECATPEEHDEIMKQFFKLN